jgi:hypothetical protein
LQHLLESSVRQRVERGNRDERGEHGDFLRAGSADRDRTDGD